jgi:Ser/Thr protein kinase RdoA (MazF antagonist)
MVSVKPMPLRHQALLEFGLPAAPQQVDELPAALGGTRSLRVYAPAGSFLLLCSSAPLGLAFESTLFDLLAESRFPAPRPLRARAGSLVARLTSPEGATAAAACFSWPPGEVLHTATATVPQLLELGRLLARLHLLAETHPAAVIDPIQGPALAARLPAGPEATALAQVLVDALPRLPSGAAHGSLGPSRALFIGDRCSAVLPGGRACSTALVLDLAEAVAAWALPAPRRASALRALVSGYQGMRRLAQEEASGLFPALRHAAAREGARRLLAGEPDALGPLQAADELGEAEVRAAAGAR